MGWRSTIPQSDVSHGADLSRTLAALPPGVDLRLLRYFVMVAETLNFRVAAERLNMSQPPLSRAIQELELRLGVVLFQRDRRNVALSRAGAQFLSDVRGVLADMEKAVERVRLAERGLKGQINIGYFGSLIYSFIPWLLAAYQELYPLVEPRLFNLPKDQQVGAMLEGRIDVGFARQYPVRSGLTSEALVDENLVLATPTGRALAGRNLVSLADLDGEPMVVFPRLPRPSFADSVLAMIAAAGAVPAAVTEMDDAAGCLAMVSAGRGSAVMPASMRMFHSPATVFVPFAAPVPTSPLACLYPAGTLPVVVENFLAVARSRAEAFVRT
ncbi:LysR substrate-binding domain-containing protein [Marinibaculum pumilum]|uniref:LysR substrate-binding domain-containing protein n=1 Tax=Marinibaculum pumilum TaxID=1766165 RepID=A0ABV7L5I0_9PROT